LIIPQGWAAEILVIDNNCSDHTAQVVAKFSMKGPLPVGRVVETKQGLSHARNRGIEEASGEHLIYLDDDMIVDPEWLEGYVEAQRILQPDCVVGPVEPLFEEPPPAWMTPPVLAGITSAYSCKGNELILLPANRAHELPGGNLGVVRLAALEAGLFDVELGLRGRDRRVEILGEDFEFGMRMVSLGRRIAYSPRCRIRHFISRTKLSPHRMRARWEGAGATTRALMQLRGEPFTAKRRLRMLLRMIRFFLRSLRYRLQGDEGHALEWELSAREILGLLFKSPRRAQAPERVRRAVP
jgi:glycosyltransferase involved in cell wall biosynthesis